MNDKKSLTLLPIARYNCKRAIQNLDRMMEAAEATSWVTVQEARAPTLTREPHKTSVWWLATLATTASSAPQIHKDGH